MDCGTNLTYERQTDCNGIKIFEKDLKAIIIERNKTGKMLTYDN